MHKRPLLTIKRGASAAPRQSAAKPGNSSNSPYSGKAPARQGKAALAQQPETRREPQREARREPARKMADRPAKEQQAASDFLPDLPQDGLAFALFGAAGAVTLVQAGSALPEALSKSFSQVTPVARGAIQDLAYRAMRQQGLCQALIAKLTSKQPSPSLLYGLLCVALSLLQKDADGNLPYGEFTVVDQSVELTGAVPAIAHGKGMMNAVLRRFLRERDSLLAEVQADESARYNYPQWWIDVCKNAYPQQWEQILLAGNQNPPLTLRVNQRQTTTEAYLQELEQAGISATRLGPHALRLQKAVPVDALPGFFEGRVSVQDAGAQLAAGLLDVKAGMRVLDACAAPGGKSCHLLESADLDLLALDSDARRLQRVADNLQRLQLQAHLQVADAQQRDWWDGRPFERILADVPCTASGIVRRHPDIRWLRRRSDTHALAQLAGRILDNLWQMLAPGGKLLFVTCSLWPQESEAQAAAFAVRQGALRLDAPGQLIPGNSAETDQDGLFYALFQKSAN